MFEPFERDVDRDVEQSMNLFRRAQVGKVAAVEPRRPGRVLLVLDGSSQDELSVRFARHFRERFQAELSVIDAREGPAANELAERAAATLGAAALPKRGGESFEQILGAIDESRCDLAIVPCPFGRDLESVGPDSAGTVIDVLLCRAPVPLLVVREPYTPAGEPLDGVVLALIGENEAAPRAAEWAVGLLEAGGRLRLTLMLETEFYENVRPLLEAVAPEKHIDPQTLSDALLQANVRLHRALQKAGDAHGFGYDLAVRTQADAALDPLDAAPDPLDAAGPHPLVVLALERGDYASEGYVRDRIRRSRHALLVVPANNGACP